MVKAGGKDCNIYELLDLLIKKRTNQKTLQPGKV